MEAALANQVSARLRTTVAEKPNRSLKLLISAMQLGKQAYSKRCSPSCVGLQLHPDRQMCELAPERVFREEQQPHDRPQDVCTAQMVNCHGATQHDKVWGFGHASGEEHVEMEGNEGGAVSAFQEPPYSVGMALTPEGILRFEDTPSVEAFLSQCLGPDGSHVLHAPGKEFVSPDERFLHTLMFVGRSDVTRRQAADMKFNRQVSRGTRDVKLAK